MANIIIKNNERKEHTMSVLKAYNEDASASKNKIEAAEHIAMRSKEVYNELKRKGARKYYGY